MARWLLPENLADSLPSEARAIENLRRRLLDLFRGYGFELVSPPLIEHIDSLLSATGADHDLQTFKLIDQLSGRTLGLRSDMTPQVTRIDAQLLNRQGVTRLCYAGSVVHTKPSGLHASREPIQIGAEIFGHTGIEADIEVMELMLASLAQAGVGQLRVDLCHPGIVRHLLSGLPNCDEDVVFALLQAKDVPGLRALLVDQSAEIANALIALTTLYGSANDSISAQTVLPGVLSRARQVLPKIPLISNALDQIAELINAPQLNRFENFSIAIDLADVRGFRYHNGPMFAAWVGESPNAIARGGRYDSMGAVFGRARPATGFSLELRELGRLFGGQGAAVSRAISAPWSNSISLAEEVAKLRVGGEIVIQSLPGHANDDQQEFICDRELHCLDGVWVVRFKKNFEQANS